LLLTTLSSLFALNGGHCFGIVTVVNHGLRKQFVGAILFTLTCQDWTFFIN